MKKLLCMILALIMVLSLCACGQETPNTNDNANNQTNQNGENTTNGNGATGEPSEEIQKMMNKYDVFATKLKNYANGEEIFCYISDDEELVGGEALTYIYKQLSDMEELDAWYGSEWMPKDDPDTEWNRQTLLAGFTVLENQLLNQSCVVTGKTEDNKTYNNAYVWEYNPDGTIANVGFVDMLHNELYPFWLELPSQLFFELYRRDGKDYYESSCSIGYEYDENGQLIQIKRYATTQDKTKFTVAMEYDANGNLVKANSINEEGQKINYSFTYDAQGRLSQVEADSNKMYVYCFKYAYNENGQLLQADGYDEKGLSRSYKYTYDADGKLTKVEYDDSWQTWPENGKVEVTFTYDAQGRAATATYSEGVFSLKNGNTYEYSKVEFQFVYGDYCTYVPAK